MGDLVKFLRARLDEDEAAAKAWLPFGNPDAAARAHVARLDPGRVLAEVEAKRRIIAEHHPVDPCDAHDASFDTIPCDTLLALASVYAEHPDYREEWKPDA
jgi:hypothetical protein